MLDDFMPGNVWLVGAGPGDPDLLTRKAERLIRAADVIFYDALVGPGVLDLIPDHVELCPVGKRSGRHSHAQDDINALIILEARHGKRVVRLKGGDPSIFGRSTEEIEACKASGIRVNICPGITTASAAAASIGCSLSLRGVARGVTFVTAHLRKNEPLDLDWQALATTGNTIAVYMGRAAAPELSVRLIEAGMPETTPVLVCCNVSLPNEQSISAKLDGLAEAVERLRPDAATMILIGDAVGDPACQPFRRQTGQGAVPQIS
jgi:uroporphyrin-III C-methyltransferase